MATSLDVDGTDEPEGYEARPPPSAVPRGTPGPTARPPRPGRRRAARPPPPAPEAPPPRHALGHAVPERLRHRVGDRERALSHGPAPPWRPRRARRPCRWRARRGRHRPGAARTRRAAGGSPRSA